MPSNRPVRRRSPRAAAFLSTALAASLACTAASAQTAAHVEIAAGPLDAALMALANQTHEQLLFTPDLVAGRRTGGLSGDFTVEEAVGRLAPGLEVRRVGPKTVALRPAGPRTATQDPTRARPFGAEPDPAPVGSAPGIGTAAAGAAPAEGAPPTARATTVAEIEVTGSHIRGAPPASPLVTLSRADLDRTGQSTLAAALQALPQNFAGGASEGNETTGGDRLARNTNYGTAINLRGLGNNATLVLVDGRRLGGSGAFGDFADVSTIPNAAVERVEVLLDGASAVYGSDAVGGVVNVILRKDLDGAETRLEGGKATAGSPDEYQVSQSFGRRWAGGGVFAAYEYQHRGSLAGADRRFAASADLRPLGGTDQRQTFSFPGNILAVNPATNALAPAFAIPAGQAGVGLKPSQLLAGAVNLGDQRIGVDLLPRQELQSGYLSVHQDVGERLQLTADARYSRRTYRANLAASVTNLTVTRANPFFISPVGGTSDTIAYSFVGDVPNPVQAGSVETLGLTLDGTLRLAGDWRAEAYATYARDRESSDLERIVNSNALNEALGTTPDNPATAFSTAASGFFNPFSGVPGSNSPAVLAFVDAGFSRSAFRDAVTSGGLQGDGTLWRLPGGALKLALGAQVRREAFARSGTSFVGTAAPTPLVGIDVSRTVAAGYLELRAPLFGPDNARPGVERLELTAAGRIESYSDVGRTTNPQLGLLWQPVADLRLRATYGTSFRAPGLREVNDPAAYGASLLAFGAARIRTLSLAGGNPGLKPETATSYSAGLDYAPAALPGFTASATWFDIKYKDRIDRPVSQSVVGALNDPALANFVTRISPATNPADLARITALITSPAFVAAGGSFPATDYGAIVDSRYVNTAALRVEGVDLSAAYRFDLRGDRIGLAANATYTLRWDQQLTPTAPVISEVGVATFPVRLRARATADWTRGRLTLGAAFNYISSYRDQLGVHIGDQPTLDLQLRLAPAEAGPLHGIAVTLNLRNVFDRDPPFYNNVFGVGYDPTNADPVGRFAAIQITRAW